MGIEVVLITVSLGYFFLKESKKNGIKIEVSNKAIIIGDFANLVEFLLSTATLSFIGALGIPDFDITTLAPF